MKGVPALALHSAWLCTVPALALHSRQGKLLVSTSARRSE